MTNNRFLKELEDIDLVDESAFTYRSKDSKSWKGIVLNHYDSCIKEGSKEMNIGGIQRRIINGEIIEVVVANQVEIFINHVEMLKRSLVAEISITPKIAKKMNYFETIRSKYITQYRDKRKQILTAYNNLSDNKGPDGYSQKEQYDGKYKKMMDHIKNIFNEKMLELYQEQLFPFLTELIAQRNYFQDG